MVLLGLGASFFYLLVDFFHIQVTDLFDQVIELLGVNGARLGEYENVFPEGHQRWNRRDPGGCSQLLLVFGIDFAKDDVVVFLGDFVIHGREHFAWAAPVGPPVNEYDVVAFDGFLESFFREVYCSHAASLLVATYPA